jgi:hypothetical protein
METFMNLLFGFFLFAIALFVVAFVLTVLAKRQFDFHLVGASVEDARNVLETSGVLRSGWKKTDGRGQFNIRPGFLLFGRDGRPVVSIDLEPDEHGTHVQIWLSAWHKVAGVIEPAHSTVVLLRRHKIVKALNAVCETTV